MSRACWSQSPLLSAFACSIMCQNVGASIVYASPIEDFARSLCTYWRVNLFEAVAQAALGQDVFGMGRVLFDLLPQIGDVEPQIMGLVAVLVAPDLGEQRFVGEQPPGIVDQMIEQAIFGWAQRYFLTAYQDLAFVEIDGQVF